MSAWLVLAIAGVAGLVLCILTARTHNRLVVLGASCDNGFSQIEVQLKRRYDLIPNLVECVRGFLAHERETLEAVVAARSQAVTGLIEAARDPGDGAALERWMGAEGVLAGALGRLSLVIESCPQLKGDRAVGNLTEELTSTENRIAFARQAYNDWVTEFNTRRQTFPTCLIASTCGFAHNRRLLQFGGEPLSAAPRIALTAAAGSQPALEEPVTAA